MPRQVVPAAPAKPASAGIFSSLSNIRIWCLRTFAHISLDRVRINAHPLSIGPYGREDRQMDATRTFGNLILEHRTEYGHAARSNRSRYSGVKIHRISADYVVGLVDANAAPRPGTMGAAFIKTGKPVLFSAHPVCGCTQGQLAAAPVARFTQADVTCTRCAS